MYDGNRGRVRNRNTQNEGSRGPYRNYSSRYGAASGDYQQRGEFPRNDYSPNDYNSRISDGSRASSSHFNRSYVKSPQVAFPVRTQRYNPLAPKKTGPNARSMRSPVPLDENGNYRLTGVLEMHPNGFGFLRDPKDSYVRHLYDPFVACGTIERLGLREGVGVEALVRPARGNTGPRVCAVNKIDGMDPEDYVTVPRFDDLVPITPHEMYRLENPDGPLSTRIMDILTPLGKGQRALIVAPPRSGKTVLLQHICQAIIRNNPDVYVTVLLVDERPEEVTDFRTFVREEMSEFRQRHEGERPATAEVVASSLDCELESHIRLAQFVTKRCKRLAEMGKDVFLLLDSITRLARAYNKWGGNTGRTMTGGLDIKAMDIPKKIFSSARQVEGTYDSDGNVIRRSGSLTIVGTALVDTGSRMDELIFQEFKGTGNMELVLDRRLADRRIWPAIDVNQSGTRHEEKLLNPVELRAASMIRRTLSQGDPIDAMERLSATLPRFKSNADFFAQFLQKNY